MGTNYGEIHVIMCMIYINTPNKYAQEFNIGVIPCQRLHPTLSILTNYGGRHAMWGAER